MATFYRCMNNGVIALVRGEVYEEMEAWQKFVRQMPDGLPHEAYPPRPRPIFTFVSLARFNGTHAKRFATGDFDVLDKLIAGHSVIDREFYVPFSNSFELNEDEDGPERKFRTTMAEVIVAFELVRPKVEVSRGEYLS